MTEIKRVIGEDLRCAAVSNTEPRLTEIKEAHATFAP
jgi:hypothetical protein